MLPLNTLFEISKRLRAKEAAPVVDSTESPTFDAAWMIYTSMAGIHPYFYTAVWGATLRAAWNNDSTPLDIKPIKEASNFVAMAYITAAHNVSAQIQNAAQEHVQAELQKEITSRVMFIEAIAGKVTQSLIAHSNTAIAKGEANVLGNDLKLVLGEFYSLTIYSLRELRTNAFPFIRFEVSEKVHDHTATMHDFDLPLFMNREDRARKEQLGKDVAVLPTRPGITLEKETPPDAEEGEGAKVITFGARKNRGPEQTPR